MDSTEKSDLSLKEDLLEPHRKWALNPKYKNEGEFHREFTKLHPKCARTTMPDRITYLMGTSSQMYPDLERARGDYITKHGSLIIKKKEFTGEKSFICECGTVSKNGAGHAAHVRNCRVVQKSKASEETVAA